MTQPTGICSAFKLVNWLAAFVLATFALAGLAQNGMAPQFVYQPPATVSLLEGETIEAYARASGSPSPRYNWQYRLAGSQDWVNLANGENVTGATATTLTWYEVSGDLDGSEIRSMATNANGAAYSDSIAVSIVPSAPKISAFLITQTAPLHSEAIFGATVYGSSPRSYQWFKGDTLLAGETGPKITLSRVEQSDEGIYSLEVTNHLGSARAQMRNLVVMMPASIVEQPLDQAARVGESVWLKASFDAYPTTTYQWFKDGQPIQNARSVAYFIQWVGITDAGSYTLEATNEAGTTVTSAAVLTVFPPVPPAIAVGWDRTATLGGSVTLSMQNVSGAGALRYQWYRDGVAVEGATSATLTISNVTLSDFGAYFLTASNEGGTSVSPSIYLTRTAPATPPSHHWIDAHEWAGVVHFLFADAARIARYDLAMDAWLDAWELPSTPKAFAWTDNALYVAYANSVVRYNHNFTNPTTIAGSGAPVLWMGANSETLVIVEKGDYDATNARLVDPMSAETVAVKRISSSPSALYAVSGAGLLLGRRPESSPSPLRGFPIGVPNSYVESIYPADTVDGRGRAWTFATGEWIAEASGQLRRGDTMKLIANLGGGLDDVIGALNAGYYALRHGVVTELDAQFRSLRQFDLGVLAERMWLNGDSLIAFAQPALAGELPIAYRTNVDALVDPPHATPIFDEDPVVWSPQVQADVDGVIYLYSKLTRNILRWSSETGAYLEPLTLSSGAEFVAVATEQSRVYFDSGRYDLRSIAIAENASPSVPFAIVGGPLKMVKAAGQFTWAATDETGYFVSSTSLVFDQDGAERDRIAIDLYEVPLAWSKVDSRMYSLIENSMTPLTAVAIGEDGAIGVRERAVVTAPLYLSRRPLVVSPDGSMAIVGSGAIVETKQFTRIALLEKQVEGAAWIGGQLHTVRLNSAGSIVELWDETYSHVLASNQLTGDAQSLIAITEDWLLVVTTEAGHPRFHHLVAGSLEFYDPYASLTVKPTITSHPDSVTVSLGQSATFTALAEGFPLSYRWRKEGHDLVDDDRISGTGTATLTIANTKIQDAGSYDVVVSNTLGALSSGSALLQFNQAFEVWAGGKFEAAELLDSAISGPQADPDGDGYVNLVEYALGLDPKVATSSRLPQLTITSTQWVYNYTRLRDRADLVYRVEISTNLKDWSTIGVTHELVASEEGSDTWGATYPIASAPNAFFRLKVEQR